MDMLAELVMLRNRRETELSELHEAYHDLIGSVSKMRMLGHEGYQQATSSNSLQLSEVANDVLEVAQNVRDCARPVAEGNVAVSQFIRQFRQELVQLRRTPVSGLFRRLQRVVRDTAQAESKQVSLELLGEDAGIERSLQQRLYEPLLHIVRNSVCHGIETPDERTQSGKMPVGTITLEAKSGPDMFMIEIRDDGRGLDYDAIRRRAVESGLLAANQPVSHEELSQLIFQPGFSTRQTADQMAGRGVGLDVVASTLQRMRGWYEVKSEPLKGTRIRLTFPLPSVIQHVMVFRSGSQLFALPMQSVQSAGEVERDSVCLSFSDLTGDRQANSADACQRIVLACEAPISREDGVSSAFVTLLVDEIVGPEEVVVRPLPSLLKQHPFCSGATLSGMGQTVLFLDARRLVESHIRLLHRRNPTNGGDPSGQAANDARPSRPRVLVVDDSISARKRVVRSLRRYPIDVVEASDGKQALEILKTQQFDAVFSDMEMPHVSGMELLAEINSDNRTDAPPVVIISSRNEDEFTERAKQLGAIRYLPKPLSDNALDGALRGIESLRRLNTNQSATSQPSMEIQ
jgi:chemosensory pili system protein ChpA (sensor histidine kinase/response regulator)